VAYLHIQALREKNFDAARGANAGNALCIAQMERAARKTGCNRSRQDPPPPWGDGTAEPNGRRLNFLSQKLSNEKEQPRTRGK
jgi:hypothetical protein